MTDNQVPSTAFLNGGGEMGNLMREKDWSTTAVGTPDTWPQSLRTSVNLLLNSQFPMFIWWGKDLTTFYNDAYRIIAGEKHPRMLGSSGEEVWAEIWQDIAPLVDSVFNGKPTWSEDQLLLMNRHGYLEETYFTFTYTPILEESGAVGGLFGAVIETTEKVLATRNVQQSERNLRNTILQSPVAMSILKGPSFVVEIANDRIYEIWGRGADELLGRPIFGGLPEARYQGLEELLNQVYTTGVPYTASERPVQLPRGNRVETLYLNFTYQPFREIDGTITGVIVVGTDVTEQVKARKEIEASREELQLAIDVADLGTFRIDLLQDKASYSPQVMEWFGFTGQGLSMKEISTYVHPEDRPHVLSALEASCVAAPNNRHDVSYRVVHPKEGTVRHLRSCGKTLFNGEGKAYLMVGVIQDITQQVLFEQHLKESEVLLQKRVEERTADLEAQQALISSILEASMAGIYALKAVRNTEGVITDFQYLFANKYIAKMLHQDVQEIIGASMLTLIPENRDNGFFDLFCKLLETGKTFQDETHFVTQSIDSWYNFVIVPLDQETVVVSIEDVTGKKQAALQLEEQRNLLDSILKNSSNGISVSRVLRDASGRVVDALTILANDAAVKYIGLPKADYLSKTATQLEPNIAGTAYFQGCLHTLQTGEPLLTQYHMESTGRWLELTVSKLDEQHLIHVFSDVTPIKEAQLQLERYVEDLKRSNQHLEEFAHAASHDMKEPLRKIRTFMDRLKSSLTARITETERGLMERIEAAAERMQLLVEDLLEFSHVSEQPKYFEAINLTVKVQRVLADLELPIEEKGAQITYVNLPTVQGNQRQLQQLFYNLISNALKYSKPNIAPQIRISARVINGAEAPIHLPADQCDKPFHLIEVSDNGIGFEQAYAELIFKMFQRLHGKAEYSGTGVGLAIARKVVENHKGYIWADSQPGEGATFKVLLPVD